MVKKHLAKRDILCRRYDVIKTFDVTNDIKAKVHLKIKIAMITRVSK